MKNSKKLNKTQTSKAMIQAIDRELTRLSHGIQMFHTFSDLQSIIKKVLDLTDLTMASKDCEPRKDLLRWRQLFSSLYTMDENSLRSSFEQVKQYHEALKALTQT